MTHRRLLLAATVVSAVSAVVACGRPAAAQPPQRIPLTVQRIDGGVGTTLVSNGIPLTPGLVRPATLPQLHVVVQGTEQRIAVRPLAGRFPDGSLRAVLIQFDYDFAAPIAVGGTLVVGGGARTTRDLAPRPTAAVPAAAALPTDPAYLVASRWGGPLTPASAPVPTMLLAQYAADYARLEAADWAKCGTSWSCGRTAGYDKAFITYQAWLRTGDVRYWYHATAEAADYLKSYIIPNPSPTPWWSQSEGVALHYWATGSDTSRYQLRKMAETLAWQARPEMRYALDRTYGDDRFRAKVLLAGLDAAMLEISTQPADAASYYSNSGGAAYYAKYLTPASVAGWVDGILATQKPNGMFGGTQYGGGQSNYMVGMLLTALIRYHDEVKADPRIPAAVKRCLDDLWANEWDPRAQGFQYNSRRGTLANSKTVPNPNPLPGLNGLIAVPFAWYAAVSGDASYHQRVDAMLAGLAVPESRNWWAASGKAFDEAFYRLFNTMAWRAGVR